MWTVYALRGKGPGTWTKHEVPALGTSFALPEWGAAFTTLRYIVVDALTRTAFAIE